MDPIEEEHEQSDEGDEEPSETHHDGPTVVGAQEPEIGLEACEEHDQQAAEREQRIGRGEADGEGEPQKGDEEDPCQDLEGRDRKLGPPCDERGNHHRSENENEIEVEGVQRDHESRCTRML